jgi:hypothetical protein
MVIRKEPIAVERHPYAGLILYEISEDQLSQLENEGRSIGEDFSFALAGLSVAASFTITLFTAKIESERLFNSFFIVTLLGYLLTIFFGVKWIYGKKRQTGIARRIRELGPLGDETKPAAPGELTDMGTAETTSGPQGVS